ncbi:hypothetical protein GCM10023185_24660 [Hymenobacter saemangeumensis]|uniref:LysM domain-containing protein n=1 Tax=Hymenobacter saemangeumensis TaxID=1084522 RepID=A0ABP8IH03_9BACT
MKSAFLLLLLVLARPLLAQPLAPLPHPDVPAAMDVAGLHLVLNEEARRLVQQRADALCRHQPSFQGRVDLADAAFPIIDKILQQEGVPLDFRYLVLQESSLKGDAVSIHDAVGYWQLKKGTATDMGLVVNDEVDERKHLVASTRAAARFLVRNNNALRNWLNALLSYNLGLGGVKPYTLPTDAGATEMAITEQTSTYVLTFLAHRIAFEPACGLNPRPPLRLQEFPAVPGQSLAVQAETIYADPLALATHNRWLLAPVVPADRSYTLIVPVSDAAQAAGLAANQRIDTGKELITAPVVDAKNAKEVRVNNLRALIALPNETREDLARRGGVKLGTFLRHNELRPFDAVVAGRPYFLESKRDEAAVEYHVVHSSETLVDIAQKYGIRRKAILVKNRMAPNEELRAGRVLWLQHFRPREVAVEYRTDLEGGTLELPVGAPRPPRKVVAVAAAPVKAPATPKAPPAAASQPDPDDDKDAATEALNEQLPAARPLPALATAPPAAALPPPAPLPADPEPLAEEPVRTASEAGKASAATAKPAPAAVVPVVAAPATPAVAAPDSTPLARPVAKPVAAAPAAAAPAQPRETDAKPANDENGQLTEHRVAAGETVYALARRYSVRPADLLAWNNLPANAGLVVGQVLRLRAAPEAAAPTALGVKEGGNPALYVPPVSKSAAPAVAAVDAAPARHTVAAGETLFSISRRYGVRVEELQAWNKKADAAVRVGEVLLVKAQ